MNRCLNSLRIFLGISLLFFTACSRSIPDPVFEVGIPLLEEFRCDGDTAEWTAVKSYRLWADPLGGFPDPADLDARFKVARNKNGLFLLFEVSDDHFLPDTSNPWKGDALEIFLSPYRGSESILQFSIIPGLHQDFIRADDYSKGDSGLFLKSEIVSFSRFEGNSRITEIEIPLAISQSDAGPMREFALQVYVNDADSGKTLKNQLVWYPVGQSYNSSSSMFRVRYSDKIQKTPGGTARLVITDGSKLKLIVFGASKGDKISVYRNGHMFKKYRAGSKYSYQPDSFDISSPIWNIDNDSLYVILNGETISFLELFLAPRLYEKMQPQRYEKEIRNFIYADRLSFPPKNATLFIGSSSIVRWESLKQDFPELQIINRGFGGSQSPDALRYIRQIVLPYKPSKIIYYEGDNDIPAGMSPEEIRDTIAEFVRLTELELPDTEIFILSPKPSISRLKYWPEYLKTNRLLKEFSESKRNVTYVDVASAMFSRNGKLDPGLFIEDGLHMTAKGYEIWTHVLREAIGLDKPAK